MKKILLSLFIFFAVTNGHGQSLNGQWKGDFDANTGDIIQGGDNTTEYILELTISGKKVTGYSYSYWNNRQYFVICTVSGTYDKENKTLDVIETARIKGVTPPDQNDCLQEHLLTYKKTGTTEILTGIWRSAKATQSGGCGTGYTTLIRNTYLKELNTYNNNSEKTKTVTHPSQTKTGTKPPAINNQAPAADANPRDSVVKTVDSIQRPLSATIAPSAATPADSGFTPEQLKYEKRIDHVLQTITIENTTFNVDLYDNGAIDGDSISLFYNNKVIISHKRLSEKAISITLTLKPDQEVNELTMYAENLGEIPPNTALMVITDGRHRYEVNVSSDLTTSGSIHFVHGAPVIPIQQ